PLTVKVTHRPEVPHDPPVVRLGVFCVIAVQAKVAGLLLAGPPMTANCIAPAPTPFHSITYWFMVSPNWAVPSMISSNAGASIANSTNAAPLWSAWDRRKREYAHRIIARTPILSPAVG